MLHGNQHLTKKVRRAYTSTVLRYLVNNKKVRCCTSELTIQSIFFGSPRPYPTFIIPYRCATLLELSPLGLELGSLRLIVGRTTIELPLYGQFTGDLYMCLFAVYILTVLCVCGSLAMQET